MKKTSTIVAVSVLILAISLPMGFAQGSGVAAGEKGAVTDGAIGKDEYAFQQNLGAMTLYLSRTKDTLYIGVTGPAGWVAVGLGSRRMNGATMFMGYVADGKTFFKPQSGVGNTHRDASGNAVSATIVSSAVKEEAGNTTLELALKAESYIDKGQTALQLIYAVGSADGFTAMHSAKGAVSIPLK